MRLTNREELRARRQAGSALVPATRTTTAQTPAGTDAAGPSAPRRRHRSGQRSRQARSERRQAERAASQRGAPAATATATLAGQRTVSGPRFPIGLRGATMAYNANGNTTMRRVPPGRHVFVARDPGAWAGDESSLGSLDALPPANLHGYAEWDFSGVPDPVMFKRFLDATDYWYGCSGSYDPTRSAVPSLPTTQQKPPARWAQTTGRSRLPQGSLRAWPRDQAPLLGPTPTRS
jgi:hypothetical protein